MYVAKFFSKKIQKLDRKMIYNFQLVSLHNPFGCAINSS